ncbi:MAG: hypothetical protein PHG91_03880 [Syntrophales bacterium]|nr:hypothetical protein [Syntrophales bacterium]MDD5532368.1 hypothetical protein [Syntrophales bacterium]
MTTIKAKYYKEEQKRWNMAQLFESAPIGSLILPNRLIRSATWEGMAAPDGSATPELNRLYADLARGGVGLIITSHTYVSPEGKGQPLLRLRLQERSPLRAAGERSVKGNS